MVRLVLQEYRMRFSWKKLGYYLNNQEGYPNLYLFFIIPIWMNIFIRSAGVFILYLLIIPMACNSVIARMSANRLPKMMYLIPMTREERGRYLRTSGILQFLIGWVPYVIFCIVMLVCGISNGLGMVGFLVSGSAYLLCNNLYMESAYMDAEIRKRYPQLKNYYGWMIGVKALLLIFMILSFAYGTTTNVITGLAGGMMTLLVAASMGAVAILWYQYRIIFELALDYELATEPEVEDKKRKVRR